MNEADRGNRPFNFFCWIDVSSTYVQIYIYIYLMNMCIYLQGINCFGKDMYQEK